MKAKLDQAAPSFSRWPLVAAASTENSQIVLPQHKPGELPRILVVEDDPAAAHLIKLHLISVGYDVLSCDRPNRVVEMAAELQPAAITMDIVMKPINGWELLLKSEDGSAHFPDSRNCNFDPRSANHRGTSWSR